MPNPPTWRTRVSLFVWLLPLDLFSMGAPASSYATAGIALRVSGALAPHHHDRVETSSVGEWYNDERITNCCVLSSRFVDYAIILNLCGLTRLEHPTVLPEWGNHLREAPI
jgi:hypothetical protein